MENTWIERSRQGDREAFAKIVDRYQSMVSAVTLSVVGDYAQSEDLAQETFLTVWKKLPELREPEKLAAWIYGIARRTALHWTEKQRQNPLRNAAEIDGDMAVDPRLELEAARQKNEQSLQLVWSTVRELPETLREPLLLYYRYSKSAAEIAESMNLSEDAVCQRLSRGRKMLKAEVEKQVESVLESTRPDTAFTLAVLAAIPLSLMTTEALAATGTAVFGKGTTTASTAGGATFLGMSWSAFVWLLNVGFGIAFYVGLFFGINHVFQNSPTLRSRRLMIQVILLHYLIGFFALTTNAMLVRSITAEPISQNIILNLAFLSGAACLVGYTVFTCLYFNRRWKTIVEEDLGLRPTPGVEREQSNLSQRCLRRQMIGAFGLVFTLILGRIGIKFVYEAIPVGNFYEISSFITDVLFVLLPHAILALIVVCMYRSTKDEETFRKFPPKYSNMLDYLTGKISTKRRPYFLIDLCLLFFFLSWFCWFGVGLSGLAFIKYGGQVSNAMTVCAFMQAIVVGAWIWQLVRYAGIPRKRYWGFAIFGSLYGVLYVSIAILTKLELSDKAPSHFFGSFYPSMVVFGASLFLAMALSGIIGLRVFRKKKIDKEPEMQRSGIFG